MTSELAAATVSGRHAVFLFNQGAGHINPTVPLVAAMTAQGVKVTYYCTEDGESIRQSVQDAGAVLRPISGSKLETDDRMVQAFCENIPFVLGEHNPHS